VVLSTEKGLVGVGFSTDLQDIRPAKGSLGHWFDVPFIVNPFRVRPDLEPETKKDLPEEVI